MPKTPHINIHHLAKLARLELSDEEKSVFGRQLPEILGYAQQVSELETEATEETAQVTGLVNVLRIDRVDTEAQPDPVDLLGAVPVVKDSYVVVPAVLGGETHEG